MYLGYHHIMKHHHIGNDVICLSAVQIVTHSPSDRKCLFLQNIKIDYLLTKASTSSFWISCGAIESPSWSFRRPEEYLLGRYLGT